MNQKLTIELKIFLHIRLFVMKIYSRFALPAARFCIVIIAKEHKETFLEAMLNICRQWYQEREKVLSSSQTMKNSARPRFIAFMAFLTEMFGQLKRRQLQLRTICDGVIVHFHFHSFILLKNKLYPRLLSGTTSNSFVNRSLKMLWRLRQAASSIFVWGKYQLYSNLQTDILGFFSDLDRKPVLCIDLCWTWHWNTFATTVGIVIVHGPRCLSKFKCTNYSENIIAIDWTSSVTLAVSWEHSAIL